MAWIESHQELRNHPKTKKAARGLNIHWAQVIGHLHALWWWAIDNAPDGDLSGYDTEELLDAAGWEGDGDLITVFCTCGKAGEAGFLERTEDGRLIIHDWWDYAGKLITKRQQNADRVKEYRARNARVTHTERAGNTLNSTVQYSTVPDELTPDPIRRAITNAYDACGLMVTRTHIDKHLETIQRTGLPAWQLGFAEAHRLGKSNIPTYVARCAETAMLEEQQRANGSHGRSAPEQAAEVW